MINSTYELNKLLNKEHPDNEDIKDALRLMPSYKAKKIINKINEKGEAIYDDSDIPLVSAITTKKMDIIQTLFRHGATTKGVNTPCIHWAVLHNSPEILEYLIERKGNVNHRHRHNGYTPLFDLIDSMEKKEPAQKNISATKKTAVKKIKNSYERSIKEEYEANAKNAQETLNSFNKETKGADVLPFKKPEKKKEDINLTLAHILLENGANPFIPTEFSNTAFKLAKDKNLTDVVKLMKKHIPMGITMKDFLKQQEKQFLSEEKAPSYEEINTPVDSGDNYYSPYRSV